MGLRKHIRLRGFDYSSTNAYFITICVKHFRHLFGEVRNGIMGLSEIGNAACLMIQDIEAEKSIILDEFTVMPNHIHCIIRLKNRSPDHNVNKFSKPVPGSVSMIINHYKGSVKKWCDKNGFNEFAWHGRFHDHVIRNHVEYDRIKQYIRNNPRNWEQDCYFSKFKLRFGSQ